MATDHPSPITDDQPEEAALDPGPATGVVTVAHLRSRPNGESGRDRSPTPPRALFRSTTGKGVAFTQEDVNFLVRFMEYRKCVRSWVVGVTF
jgi:hypothetical protein